MQNGRIFNARRTDGIYSAQVRILERQFFFAAWNCELLDFPNNLIRIELSWIYLHVYLFFYRVFDEKPVSFFQSRYLLPQILSFCKIYAQYLQNLWFELENRPTIHWCKREYKYFLYYFNAGKSLLCCKFQNFVG